MTADRPIYEPEVEELLRELAADPTSTLLRVPRRGIVPTLFDKHTLVSPRAAGLSSAERHLLQVYREEVELLLRQAYLLYCRLDEPFGPAYCWHVTVGQRQELPAMDEWTLQAERALGHPLKGDGAPEARELLSLCVRESPTRIPSPIQLAAAALRLVPSNQARIYVATDLVLSGRTRTGMRGLRDVLACCSSSHESYCLQNMTRAYEDLGDIESAAQSASDASRADESRPDPLLNWFVLSARMTDLRSTLEAAKRIDDLLVHDHIALVEYLEGLSQRRAQGWWKPSRDARAFLSGIQDQLGPASRSIAHACR